MFELKNGHLVVYRTWEETSADHLGATYREYAGYEPLMADPSALQTMWLDGDPESDRKANYTPELRAAMVSALERRW